MLENEFLSYRRHLRVFTTKQGAVYGNQQAFILRTKRNEETCSVSERVLKEK